jgi:succinylglutamic semialdehyde dehydrogenase
MKQFQPVKYLGDYIAGKFILPTEVSGEIKSTNPGNIKDVIGQFSYSLEHVNEAVSAAKKAFPLWAALSIKERATYLKKFYAELETHLGAIAELIARETGKPVWEATQEARGLLGKIRVTQEEGMNLVAECEVPNAQPNITGRYRYKPKGVMAVLGPFNFPAHLPHGHYIPALLTGNTVIFKPSEQCPAVGQLLAECVHRSGFPPGVFNLIQGEKEVGKRLVLAEVDGVLFTGSYEVGLRIKKETVSHFWKTLALEMGGKNAAIVCDDADVDKALFETIMGAYLTTGQRCSATSRLILSEKIADQFLESFHELSKAFKIGYAFDDDPPFMGPLITEKARENYIRFQGIAKREGGEPIMRGKGLDMDPSGFYVTPSIYLMPPNLKESVFFSTEIFGPSVGVMVVKNIDEAIAISNKSAYGLATSVFTKSKKNYEKVFHESKTGIVNLNRATCGASSKLPFGGQGKSGNQFSTGLFATYYCTYPVASLEDNTSVREVTIPPGLPFKSRG